MEPMLAPVASPAAEPTAVERLAFDVAVKRSPTDFMRTCRALERDPRAMLALFDAEPWRWTMYFEAPSLLTDSVRARPFPAVIRQKLDAVRVYVEAPWWRHPLSHVW